MQIEDWEVYVKNEREKYLQIGYVECPVFGDEKIYFNHYGFYHILYKNGVPRPQQESIERFRLLKYVPDLLKITKYIDNEEKRVKNNSIAYFWTIRNKVSGMYLRIILRRLGNAGKLHFFSVMSE